MTADPTDETLVARAKTYIHTHSRDPALVEELVAAIASLRTSLAASRRAGIEEAAFNAGREAAIQAVHGVLWRKILSSEDCLNRVCATPTEEGGCICGPTIDRIEAFVRKNAVYLNGKEGSPT